MIGPRGLTWTDEMIKLSHLSLVSKIGKELENHLSLNDKDLGKKVFKVNLLLCCIMARREIN